MIRKITVTGACAAACVLLAASSSPAAPPAQQAREVRVELNQGHAGEVRDIAFSPDGKLLASAGIEKTIILWDIRTGKVVRRLTGNARCVTFSPDGAFLAAGGNDARIRVWNVAEGREVLVFDRRDREVYGYGVNAIRYSPDGGLIATGMRRVDLWDAKTGKHLDSLTGDTSNILSIAFSADGGMLASANDVDGTIKLFDVKKRSRVRTLKGHTDRVHSMDISSDGTRVVSSGWKELILWETATGKRLKVVPYPARGEINVAFSPDGETFIHGGEILDGRTGERRDEIISCAKKKLFSPDGSMIAGFCRETIYLWHARSDIIRRMRPENKMEQGYLSLSLSADGGILATAGQFATIIWDTVTGKPLRRQPGFGGSVSLMSLRPDGRAIASAGYARIVRIWDPATGKTVKELRDFRYEVYSLSYSPDGRFLAVGTYRDVVLFNGVTGDAVKTLPGHETHVYRIVFSRDGKLIATGDHHGNVMVRDIDTGKKLAGFRAHPNCIAAMAFSPDGKLLATGSTYDYEQPRLWEVRSGKPVRTFEGHRLAYPMTFSPDGRQVLIGDYGNIRVHDAATGLILYSIPYHTSSLAFTPEGNMVFVSGKEVILWRYTRVPREIGTLKGMGIYTTTALIAPDFRTVAVHSYTQDLVYGHRDLPVMIKDLARGKSAAAIKDTAFSHWEFSPDARLVAVPRNKEVHLVETADGTTRRVLKGEAYAFQGFVRIRFSPDGALLAFGNRNNAIEVWNVSTGEKPRVLKGHEKSVSSLAFSPDGKLVASGSEDKTLRCWSMVTGEELYRKKYDYMVPSVEFSPDGKLLASGTFNRIELLDAATGKQLRLIKSGISSWIRSLAFNPDGKTLASGCGYGSDYAIRLWNVQTGALTGTLTGHGTEVLQLYFSKDGKHLISRGDDSNVRLWDTAKSRWSATVMFLNDKDWAVIASDGRYDGTAKGVGEVHYIVDNEVVLGRDFDRSFYTAGLYASLLGLVKAAAPPAVDAGRSLIGKIYTAAGGEIVVASGRAAELMRMGTQVYTVIDGKKVRLQVTFSMMTTARCRLVDAAYAGRMKAGMPVFK